MLLSDPSVNVPALCFRELRSQQPRIAVEIGTMGLDALQCKVDHHRHTLYDVFSFLPKLGRIPPDAEKI